MTVSIELHRSTAGDRDVTVATIQDEDGNILSTGVSIRNPGDPDSPVKGNLLALLRASGPFADWEQVEIFAGYALAKYRGHEWQFDVELT